MLALNRKDEDFWMRYLNNNNADKNNFQMLNNNADKNNFTIPDKPLTTPQPTNIPRQTDTALQNRFNSSGRVGESFSTALRANTDNTDNPWSIDALQNRGIINTNIPTSNTTSTTDNTDDTDDTEIDAKNAATHALGLVKGIHNVFNPKQHRVATTQWRPTLMPGGKADDELKWLASLYT